MRSYEMTEVVARGLDACLDEAYATAADGTAGVFLSVDIDVVDPGWRRGPARPSRVG
jgi:agmatinase